MDQIIHINQIIPSKQSLEGIINNLTLSVIDNEQSATKQVASLDFIAKACEQAKEILKPFVIDELQKDPANKNHFGYKMELAEVGTKYDFTNCNDPKLKELYLKMEDLKTEIKDRENFLKAIKDHEMIVDEESGEMIKIFPPVKKSSSSYKMTLQ